MKYAFCIMVAVALWAGNAFAQLPNPTDPLSLFSPQPCFELGAGKLGNADAVVESTYACVPADSQTEATLTIRLSQEGKPVSSRMLALLFKDGDGRLIPEQPVTNEKGEAKFTYRAGRLAITNRLELVDVSTGATMDFVLPTSLCAQVKIELVDPVAYAQRQSSALLRPDLFNLSLKAFPEALPADKVSSSRITAQLTYKDGRPAAGFPITFSIANGTGSIIQEQKVTDAQGYITAFYRVGDTVGIATIEAVELTTGKRAAVDITIVEAGPAKLKLWLMDLTGTKIEEKATMPADGASTITCVAQVLSLVDTPIAGAKVHFALKDNLGMLEIIEAVTDGNGEIHAVFTASTITGVETITAYLISE